LGDYIEKEHKSFIPYNMHYIAKGVKKDFEKRREFVENEKDCSWTSVVFDTPVARDRL
jgi:hypothetical protein